MSSTKRDLETSEEEEQQPKVEKKQKTANKNEEAVFQIGAKRKVTVSLFKGQVLVNIREFYEDKMTGEEKPGSKGIALTKDQWEALRGQLAEIDEAVKFRSS